MDTESHIDRPMETNSGRAGRRGGENGRGSEREHCEREHCERIRSTHFLLAVFVFSSHLRPRLAISLIVVSVDIRLVIPCHHARHPRYHHSLLYRYSRRRLSRYHWCPNRSRISYGGETSAREPRGRPWQRVDGVSDWIFLSAYLRLQNCDEYC
jgi:hypothetical protein